MIGRKESRRMFWGNTSVVIFTHWGERCLANFIFQQSPLQAMGCLWWKVEMELLGHRLDLREILWCYAAFLCLQNTLGSTGKPCKLLVTKLKNPLGLLAEEIWLTLQVLVMSIWWFWSRIFVTCKAPSLPVLCLLRYESQLPFSCLPGGLLD